MKSKTPNVSRAIRTIYNTESVRFFSNLNKVLGEPRIIVYNGENSVNEYYSICQFIGVEPGIYRSFYVYDALESKDHVPGHKFVFSKYSRIFASYASEWKFSGSSFKIFELETPEAREDRYANWMRQLADAFRLAKTCAVERKKCHAVGFCPTTLIPECMFHSFDVNTVYRNSNPIKLALVSPEGQIFANDPKFLTPKGFISKRALRRIVEVL
jgi:hypothetical protein